MKAYKGFNTDMTCRGYQFEEGKTYEEEKASLCNRGFHACEDPLDCLSYYPLNSSLYHAVELMDVDSKREQDSKVCARRIKIGARLSIKEIVHISVEYVKSVISATTGDGAHAATTGYGAHAATTGYGAHAATTGYRAHAATTGYGAHAATTGYEAHAATTGYRAHAATTGYRAHAATTGDEAHAATTGYGAHAATTGYRAIAIAVGIKSRAKAAQGGWIVLAEWEQKNDKYILTGVKAVPVDGAMIKADTWYMLKNGEFVETEDDENE